MPKDDGVYVAHMRDSSRKALALLGSKSRADFDGDETLILALTHLIQVIGEAARNTTDLFQPDVVWTVVKEELAPLVAALEKV